jgi:hypothetical protein
MISGDPSDGQWQNKTFSETEMALFTELDTVDLTGTVKPASIMSRYPLPNPFHHYIGMPIVLDSDYNGDMLVKYVIVNTSLKPVQKGVERIEAMASSYFTINPTFSNGRYRLYFTLSAAGAAHFYKSWGNIEHQ